MNPNDKQPQSRSPQHVWCCLDQEIWSRYALQACLQEYVNESPEVDHLTKDPEFNDSWEKTLVENPIEVVDGYISISDHPGLGIELNLDQLAKHRTAKTSTCLYSNLDGRSARHSRLRSEHRGTAARLPSARFPKDSRFATRAAELRQESPGSRLAGQSEGSPGCRRR